MYVKLCFARDYGHEIGQIICHKIWIPDLIQPEEYPWDELRFDPGNVQDDPRPVPWLEALGHRPSEIDLVHRIEGATVGPALRDLGVALHAIRTAASIQDEELRGRLFDVAMEVANASAAKSLTKGSVTLDT